MLWLQTIPSFVVWMVFVWWKRRWLIELPSRFEQFSRAGRILLMLVSLIGSLGMLFLGLLSAERLGLMPDGMMTIFGFAAVSALGIVFLTGQMIAFALTLSIVRFAETQRTIEMSNPSKPQIPYGEQK